ncbi:polygalacturonase-like [Diabrotica undecimpunctata]|uniref:polygalacturonase-like n=1 Tax=Diabrotica undecimpunctata TaxID=50387 RepID=UPI003B63D0E1
MNLFIIESFILVFFFNSLLFISCVDQPCTITSFSQVSEVLQSCKNITISNLNVPAGQQLNLDLLNESTVTFEGVITFGVAHWKGHLIVVKGHNVRVQGAPGSILNGQGQKYWDGQGGGGGITKPKFFYIETTGGSIFKNIYLYQCANWCVGIGSKDVIITGWTIDNTAGDKDMIALNTDGFSLIDSENVLIENSIIMNQDDCIVVRRGNNMTFRNIKCFGSHGLSFATGFHETDGPLVDKKDDEGDVATDITFEDCLVANGLYGIHIKTAPNGKMGRIENVVFKNIKLSGIQEDGIYIQQDYGDIGKQDSNVKIKNLTIKNVYGSLQGLLTRPIHVFCGNQGTCSEWIFSNINILGGNRSYCNYQPDDFIC